MQMVSISWINSEFCRLILALTDIYFIQVLVVYKTKDEKSNQYEKLLYLLNSDWSEIFN